MRAAIMFAAGDVRIEEVSDPSIVAPTDAIVRVIGAGICGTDLWNYAGMERSETGQSVGHEAVGVVEDVGADVRTLERGDAVIMPFASSDGTCDFCREGLPNHCAHVGFIGALGMNGAQAEALRIPFADGTLYKLPVAVDSALMPSLVTLSDVMATGHYAATLARVKPGVSVAVVGDGAVGLCAVIAADRLGADQIIIMGRHEDRTSLARELGATDVVAERGDAALNRIEELTGGFGVHGVLECVGSHQSAQTALEIVRPGGAVGLVGAPHYPTAPLTESVWMKNISIGGGPAPARAYIDELLPDVLAGEIDPGRVFDRRVGLDSVPDGYRAMAERESIKVLVTP